MSSANESTAGDRPVRFIGLLVVHGIGEQTKGETSEKLVRGLLRVYGNRIAVARSASGGATGLSLGATTLRLYEVHWADILSGERVRGTWDWENFEALSWFPWLNWRHGLLPAPEYSALRVFAWTLLLVPASLLLWFVYWGARFIAMVREGDHEQASGPGNVEAPSEGRVASDVSSLTVTLPARWRAFVKRAREDAERRAHQRTAIEKLLDTVAGDVSNYMASLGSVSLGAGSAGPEIASREILARFHHALRRALDDGCDEIQILAHSLGTVIAYHGLTGESLKKSDAPRPGQRVYRPLMRLTRFYTIGSPLEKIRFFWPTLVGKSLVGSVVFAEGQPRLVDEGAGEDPKFRWDNFYHRFDLVSGVLRRFGQWGRIRNHALKGGGGLIRSHVIYEQSPEFLGILTEGVFGKAEVLHLSPGERLKDRVLTWLENLGLPVALGFLMSFGVALVAFTIPVASLIFWMPFYMLGAMDWVWGIWGVVGAMFVILGAGHATFQVRSTARRLHGLWVNGPG